MDAEAMARYITETFDGVETSEAYGYTFFFYGSDHRLPFATMAASDNEHDRVSDLDRPGVYRLNVGVGRDTYRSLFGTPGVMDAGHDFTALDQVMPHPVYAPQSWICVLNPGDATLQSVKSYLAEAHAIAVRRNARTHPPGQ